MQIIDDLTIEEIRRVLAERVQGKITPAHDEFGHHYRFPNGKVVDSITQKIYIPKPHLLRWNARKALEEVEPLWPTITDENREAIYAHAVLAGERHRDDAGNVGTLGHDAIEQAISVWIATGAPPEQSWGDYVKPNPVTGLVESRAIAVARSAQQFFKDHPYYVPLAAELLVGDERLGIAGTLDVLLYDTRTCAIIVGDWKSSNSVSDDYAPQVATYRHCLQVMTGLKISTTCLILKLSKSRAAYDKYLLRHASEAFRMYRNSAKVYDWVHNGKPKLVQDKKILSI